jgi:hypothetical protein
VHFTGGFGDRPGRAERAASEPSRADAAGDWGSERKFVPSDRPGGGGGGGFGGGFRDRDSGGFGDRRGGGDFGDRPPREERPVSKADTVDDWGANRKFQPSAGEERRGGGGGFGGGFRDRERPAGPPRFGDDASHADAAGDWGARRSTPDSDRPALVQVAAVVGTASAISPSHRQTCRTSGPTAAPRQGQQATAAAHQQSGPGSSWRPAPSPCQSSSSRRRRPTAQQQSHRACLRQAAAAAGRSRRQSLPRPTPSVLLALVRRC